MGLSPRLLTYLSIFFGIVVLGSSLLMLLSPQFFARIDRQLTPKKERKVWLYHLALALNYAISVTSICCSYLLMAIIFFWLEELTILGIWGLSMLIASVLFFSLKRITQRARPEDALLKFKDYSFPSGHTTAGFVFFLSIALWAHWGFDLTSGAWIGYGFALLAGSIVGWSRRYLKVHRVSDILIGAALWCGSFLFSYLLFFYFWEPVISVMEQVFFSLW